MMYGYGITMNTSVPLPPPDLQMGSSIDVQSAESSTGQHRLWWALPLLTVAWLSLASVIAASLISLRLWELAPGSVEQVANR